MEIRSESATCKYVIIISRINEAHLHMSLRNAIRKSISV
ncbi:hypothetical protein BVRB_1g020480 [Beta vulgaris subsp. vulgaris]|nr:hypothetical protein BVRB_1g020480 [Beta vulgaris subsp. vulgaris]